MSAGLALLVGGLSVLACVLGGRWLFESPALSSLSAWEDWQLNALASIAISSVMALFAFLYGKLWKSGPLKLGERPLIFSLISLMTGITLMLAVAVVAVVNGRGVVTSGFPLPVKIVPFLVIAAAILIQVCAEEMMFRGWLLPVIERAWGKWIALILSAGLFSAIHILGGVDHWFSYVNLFLGGIALGLIYLKTKGLAAPIALHFGFNWSEYNLFGMFPQNIDDIGQSLMDIDITGGILFGDGKDGVNTAVAITAGFVLVITALLLSMRTRKASLKPTNAPIPEDIVSQHPSAADGLAVSVDPEPVGPPRPRPLNPAPAVEETIFSPLATPFATLTPQPLAENAALNPVPPEPAREPSVPIQTGNLDHPPRTLTGTHQGAVRTVNEDRFYSAPELGIWAVADGMGGHRFGDRASTLIVEQLQGLKPTGSLDDRVNMLRNAAMDVNKIIYDEAQTNGSRMGSTLVSCVIEGGRIGLVWAGDSRAYRLRGGELAQLTRDHTQVQELVDRGELTIEQAARHPMSHVLVRAVGVLADLEVDMIIEPIEAGDVFFLCSDGIYDALDESEIVELLKRRGDDHDLSRLIDLAVAQGARDNVTAIAIIPGEQPKTENGI